MNEELKIIIKAVTSEAQKNLEEVKKELQGIEATSKKSGKSISNSMASIGKGVTIALGAIVALTGAMVALGKSSMEFRKTQAQLVAGFQSMGMSAKQAGRVYEDLFGFLGESDRAVEAANQLAHLSQNSEALTEWTTILQGVYAKFPDSLPVESLAEAANETSRTGVITGALADALNWAGASEEAFQAALDNTNSAAEREALIRSTLNGLYSGAASLYQQNNKALIEYNKSQVALDIALAEATKYVTPLMTSLNNLGATMLTYLSPAIHTVSVYLTALIQLLAEAIEWTASFFGMMSGAVSAPSADIAGYQKAMEDYLASVQGGFDGASNGADDYNKSLEKLKKQTMGFDELNVMSSPTAAVVQPGGSVNTPSSSTIKPPNAADYGLGADAMAARQEVWNKQLEKAKSILKPILGLVGAIAAAIGSWKLYGFLGDVAEAVKLVSKFRALDIIRQIVPEEKLPATLAGILKIKEAFAAIGPVFAKIGTAISGAVKAVGAFIAGLSAGTIALIIAIVAAVASAVYFLWKNWDAVGEAVKNFFANNIAPKLETIKGLFIELWGAIQELGAAFASVGVAIWNALPEGLQNWLHNVWQGIKDVVAAVVEWFKSVDWLKAIGAVFEWLGGFVVGILGGVIGGAINGVMSLIQGAVGIVTGVVQIISGIVSGLINLIVALFTGDFSKALDSVNLIWDGIVNVFKGAYDATIGVVVELVKGIIDWFVEMWDVLVGHSIVPDTIEAIIDWFLQLPKQLFTMISNFVKTIIDFFKNLATNAGTVFSNMVANIKKPFASIATWFKDIFTKAWTNVKNVFSTGGKIFDGIKSGISSVFTTVVNGLITGINKVIAAPFNSINGILNGIRSINILGVTPFSGLWSKNPLAVPQIPKLATGGLVDGATLAMIGERGREAVLPLDNNTGWMDMLADRIAARNSTPTKIVLKVGEKELGWATINSINDITKQTGGLQLHLV